VTVSVHLAANSKYVVQPTLNWTQQTIYNYVNYCHINALAIH